MPSMSLKQVSRSSTKGLDNVESIMTASGTPAGLRPFAEHKNGTLDFFSQLACYQPNNAFGPIIATHQYHLILRVALYLFSYTDHQLFRLTLARLVEFFQFPGIIKGFFIRNCCQEIEGNARILHASGRINARSQYIGNISFANFSRLQVRHKYKRHQTGIL